MDKNGKGFVSVEWTQGVCVGPAWIWGSSLPQVKSLDEYVDLVLQFCDYLNIKKVVLVCHSLGARVGITWATGKYKEMVEKLVLVDPAGPKEFSLKRASCVY